MLSSPRFFGGFDLVEYGLAQVPLWRPDGKPPRAKNLTRSGIYAGPAVKKG
jgi:hypothetical protein